MTLDSLPTIGLDRLTGGPAEVVLCPSTRLADDLRRAHGGMQRDRGRTTWLALEASTVPQWLQHVCSAALLRGEIPAAAAPGMILSAAQERRLWARTIGADLGDAAAVFDVDGMAATAMDAERMRQVWKVPVGTDQATPEAEAFARWRQRLEEECQQRGWLTRVQAIDWWLDCLGRGVSGLPHVVAFAGFVDVDPQVSRLLCVLGERGIPAMSLAFSRSAAVAVQAVKWPDVESECEAAARWAGELLRWRPDARVRIAAADARLLRAVAERLDRELHPDWVGASWAGEERWWSMIGGERLLDAWPVRVALSVLELGTGTDVMAQMVLGNVLRGPGWAGDMSEADARARIEAMLREQLPPECSGADWLRAVMVVAEPLGADRLRNACRILLESRRQQSGRRAPGEWGVRFSQLLQRVGWPGERELLPGEAAQCAAWRECLHDLAAMEPVTGTVTVAGALRELHRLVADRVLRERRRTAPAVELCSLGDALAAPADGLWVMGLGDDAWPPPARPNPLLPAATQRRLQVPEATAEVLLDRARRTQEGWTRSAAEVRFSWAESDGGRPRRPSILLAGLPCLSPAVPSVVRDAPPLEAIDDACGPPLDMGDPVRGGTGLLRAQAICPAWAFYRYRLGAAVLPAPTFGLDAMGRGSVLHAALEVFWRSRSSADLRQLGETVMADAIRQAAGAGIDNFLRRSGRTLGTRQRQLEEERLQRLLTRWIAVEMRREEAFRVEACEAIHDLRIDGLPVQVVVDRIDRLGDGRLAVIDYKSGRNVSMSSWADLRIVEPQLPVYAAFVLPEGELAAVVLARVVADKPGFVGIAREGGLLPDIKALDDERRRFPADRFPDWEALRAHWAGRLADLAGEIRRGEAGVRFADEKLLAHCDVLPLLRIAERRLQWESP